MKLNNCEVLENPEFLYCIVSLYTVYDTEVGIYKRKQELDQESDQESKKNRKKTRTRPRKRSRKQEKKKQELDHESDQEKKKILVFLFSFINSHLRVICKNCVFPIPQQKIFQVLK